MQYLVSVIHDSTELATPPPNPGAWLTTTASRKAVDRIRRENKLGDKQKEA